MLLISVMVSALLYLACAIFYLFLGVLATPLERPEVRYCYFSIAAIHALLASIHFVLFLVAG